MRFVALDVETANPDMSSICQIGIVHFEDGKPVETWSSLVDPQDYFDDVNVSIHGIEREDVRGAPIFNKISAEINRRVGGQVVAIHTVFDRSAITQAASRHGAMPPECFWLNTASVARRAWPEVAQRGYGLAPLAVKLGIEFEHHDAAEDARAAGMILVRAMTETGLDLAGWMDRVKHPIHPSSVAHAGNPEGPLYGEVVAFTGALIIPRHEAADLAARAGCETTDGVTKHTTLLVVGDQDIRLLNGQEKSNKHRKAEELIAKGKPIRILTETDFLSMVAQRF
jgi:DNA polymerase III subunit epsilon